MTGKVHLPGIPWVQAFEKDLADARHLEQKMRREDSLVDSEALYLFFDSVLPSWAYSAESLKRCWQKHKQAFAPRKEDYILPLPESVREEDFPDRLSFAGLHFKLVYEFDPGEKDDGITLHAREDELNLLPRHVLDYLVPGYLGWKVDYMLRGLPKSIRKELMPLSDCTELFVEECRKGNILMDQKLSSALADFLKSVYGQEIADPSGMEDEYLPEFLRMKLAVHSSENGRILRVVTEMPESRESGSKISSAHKISKLYEVSGCTSWPGADVLPISLPVADDRSRLVYPALTDESEKTVGISLFLNSDEAAAEHERGIFRLYRMEQGSLVRYLKNSLKIPSSMKLALFQKYSEWQDDFMNNAIREALRIPLVEIRSGAQFQKLCEESRDILSELVAENLEMLEQIHEALGKADRLLDRLPEESFTFMDASRQLDFLFRKGFLRIPEAVQQYRRYLKSLTVRLERALQSPAKDREKGLWLDPYLRKFHLVLSMDQPLERMKSLADFFLYLEEARISAFTPELQTLRKVSPPLLEKAWNALKMPS